MVPQRRNVSFSTTKNKYMTEAGNCVERAMIATLRSFPGMMCDEETWINEEKHFVTIMIFRT